MELAHPLPSDGQLVVSARDGSESAWAEIEARHGAAVHLVAKSRHVRGPGRAAQAALARLRSTVVDGVPPREGASAVRALRPLAISELTAGTYGPLVPGDHDADADAGAVAVAEAFARLPAAWQTVLWHGVVEQLTPAEMTPLIGRGVNEVTALQRTATSGLHESYLRVVLDGRPGVADECRGIVPLLGAASRGTLAAHDQRLVEAHLTSGRGGRPCRECRARVDVVDTIDVRLPPAVLPGISGLSVDRYRSAVVGEGQAFGSAALFESRSDRVRRFAIVSAGVAVALALVGAVLLIRRPFDSSVATVDPPVPAESSVATTEPPDDTTTTSSEPPAPTTTELQLRPTPSGPRNTVELVFAGQGPAQGVTSTPLDLRVALSSPAPVFAGGTGTVDVAITNAGAEAAELGFEVREPSGLLFDRLVDGAATCVDREEGAPLCSLALEPGETETLALRFLLESTVVGRLVVDSELADDPLEVAIEATPRLVHSSVGRGDVVMIGNSVTSCAEAATACADARNLRGDVVNRWDLPISFIGADPAQGWSNSSAATLDLPSSAAVDAAYLMWSGDLNQRGQQVVDGSNERVTLRAPGQGGPIVVEADRILLGDVDATLYMGIADVTDVVAAAGPGDYLVADVSTVEVSGTYGGWSLVVVTADGGQPRRQLVMTAPFSWFAPTDDYVASIPVPVGPPSPASLDVLAFEGEPDFQPEEFVVGGTVLGGENPFLGAIDGPREPSYVNNFGMDLAAYDLTIDEPDGSLTVSATSAKDGVRMAVIGLAVDLGS